MNAITSGNLHFLRGTLALTRHEKKSVSIKKCESSKKKKVAGYVIILYTKGLLNCNYLVY